MAHPDATRMSRRVAALAGLIGFVVLGVAACGGAGVQTGIAPLEDLVWPAPPEAARIRYLGLLHSEADLGKRPSFFGRVSRALAGAQDDPYISILRPSDVYAEDSTRVYVTDATSRQLLVFDHTTKQAEVFGGSGQGRLIKPMGLGGDRRGHVYVTDATSRRVVVFGPTGEFVRAFGGPTLLLNPVDVAVDPVAGHIYVADSYLHQIVVFDQDGNLVRRVGRDRGDIVARDQQAAARATAQPTSHRLRTGPRDMLENRGHGVGEFLFPVSVAVAPDGTMYVCDAMNFRVQVFDAQGEFQRQFGRLGDTPGAFARPKGLSVDSNGHVYVVDAAFNNVQVFDSEGRLLIGFAGFGSGPGEFWLPMGIAIDASDRIYVADRYNARVQIFEYLEAPEESAATEPVLLPPVGSTMP